MPLTKQQIRLASRIDRYVVGIVTKGGGDEELLVSMYDHMPTLRDVLSRHLGLTPSAKQLMDNSTSEQMNELCQRYDGFYRYAKLLEQLAEGIANGTIPVPK